MTTPRDPGPSRNLGARFGAWLVAVATALVILGASILPLLNPAYVRLEQDRVGVARITGFDASELDVIAGALLGDIVLLRGDFDVAVDGAPVLDDRERAHMRDVRGVFAGLGLLVAIGAVVLAAAFRRTRGTEARFEVWRAVASGARGLAIGVAIVGTFAVLAFPVVFEVFHRLFFSAGSYTFDPGTDRLVQLFPQQFWSETAMALGVVVLGVAILAAWQASRRAGAARAPARLATSRARP